MTDSERLDFEAAMLVNFYTKHILELKEYEYVQYNHRTLAKMFYSARIMVERFGYNEAETIVKNIKRLTL